MSQKYSNVSAVPLALAVFLATDNYDHNPDPLTISATTLLKPLRQIILSARVPQEDALIDLASEMTTSIGAAIHDGIERAWRYNHRAALKALGYPDRIIERFRIDPTDEELAANPDIYPVYLEQRASRKVGKWTVTGKWDMVLEGQVEDYKSTSVWAYQNQVNADKQIKQGSIYRWLDPKKITQPRMAIHHIFKDWKAGMVATDPTYPADHFCRQMFDLMSIEETDRFIRNKLDLIEQYWDAPEDQIPHCDEEELWRSKAVFKFYKNGDTTAKRSTKNFESMHDARVFQSTNGGVGAIKEVPGEVKACKYCAAFPICTQKDAYIASGDLVL